jgi:hypothetical protein
MKTTDAVLVHLKWHPMHEINANGTIRCGNPLGKIEHQLMLRSQAQGTSGSHPCPSLAGRAAGR